MNCVEVRDSLTEHALGLLPAHHAAEVDRHLHDCTACRKEARELQDGVATVAFALTPAEPPPGLEERIVGRLSALSPRAPEERLRDPVRRQSMRALVASTLAALLLATGAVGWAMAERHTAQSATSSRMQDVHQLKDLLAGLGGQPFHAQLLPTSQFQSSGFAVIVSTPAANNFVFVDILPPKPETGPYTVQLVDGSGRVLSLEQQLMRSDNGDLLLWDYPQQDLSKAITVSILDRFSNVVMRGTVSPYSQG